MKPMIFETSHGGHRLQYVRMLIEAINGLGLRPIVVLPQNIIQTTEYQTHLKSMESLADIQAVLSMPSVKLLGKNHGYVLQLVRAMSEFQPHHTFIPWADGINQLMTLQSWVGKRWSAYGSELEGLIMRGRYAYPFNNYRDFLKSRLLRLLTRHAPLQYIHLLDPFVYEHLMALGGSFTSKCDLVPEPVEPFQPMDKTTARRLLDIPQDGRYLGCVGAIDRRKGMDYLLMAYAKAKLADHDRLLLMGKIDPEIQALLDQSPFQALIRSGRILLKNTYVNQDEFFTGLCAMDLVTAPYPMHIGSSGIVVRATAMHRPLLGSMDGWIGMVIPRFGLGTTCQIRNVDVFAQEITTQLDRSANFVLSPQGCAFRDYHTVENFIAHWQRHLAKRLGHSQPTHLRTWDQVLAAR